jgi:hypothetical protein
VAFGLLVGHVLLMLGRVELKDAPRAVVLVDRLSPGLIVSAALIVCGASLIAGHFGSPYWLAGAHGSALLPGRSTHGCSCSSPALRKKSDSRRRFSGPENAGLLERQRLKEFEPSTFCMASSAGGALPSDSSLQIAHFQAIASGAVCPSFSGEPREFVDPICTRAAVALRTRPRLWRFAVAHV